LRKLRSQLLDRVRLERVMALVLNDKVIISQSDRSKMDEQPSC
jgi:hypothetical protein